MNKGKNILDQFENFQSIEPSSEWSERLFLKLSNPRYASVNSTGNKLILFAIATLLTINVLNFIGSRQDFSKQQNLQNLKIIASEFLINTNSSKY